MSASLKNHTDCKGNLVSPKFSFYSNLMTVWSVKTFVVSDAHFEKMLYDNALLARVYLHAWQVTGEPLFRATVEETLDYVIREMTSPAGAFYATQDADTEGEEGKTYVWSPNDVQVVLEADAERFMALYGVTPAGNFEGLNILTFSGTIEERQELAGTRARLLAARDRRTTPGRDEKVLASWNGLMLAAFAEAARVLDEDRYRVVAERNAGFLLRELRTAEGRLMHVWYGGDAGVQGLLEDYTYLIEGLIALYQTTFEVRWMEAAQELMGEVFAHFSVEPDADGPVVAFYDTPEDAPNLVLRPCEIQDNAVPSGNSVAATVLQKLARLSGDAAYEKIAIRSLGAMQSYMAEYPLGFGQWLVALDSALAIPVEVAIVGHPEAEDTRALIEVARAGYAPHRLLVAGTGSRPQLLAHREQVEGRATAYVCRGQVCQPPVTDPEALRALIS
jgi:uncharacterized protein